MAPSGSWWSHTREPIIEAENNLDPDDGNSTLCTACRLPIFSTPTIANQDDHPLHDQCAHHLFPAKLEAYPLHPGEDLILHQQQQQHSTSLTNNKCSRCGSMCGTSYYKCPPGDYDPGQNHDGCDFQLDLVCALPINWILHRSHPHRLTVIKGKSLTSFTCGVCGTQHDHHHQQPPAEKREWQVYYMCIPCDFWIHPDCAILPNAIQIFDGDKHRHPHPLLLKYLNPQVEDNKCAICDWWCDLYLYGGWGVYECFHCNYSADIKCALYSDHVSFKPVLIRDAQVPGLLRLPFPNETTSVMSYILTTTTDGINSTSVAPSTADDDGGKLLLFKEDIIHEHPLTLHDHHDPSTAAGGGVAHRICNACVQIISPSDPFYSCSTNLNINNNIELGVAGRCGDFFLHECCAHLPTTLSTRLMSHNNEYHHLTLVSKPDLPGQPFNMFDCNGCRRECNGFAYACEDCDNCVDVVCAFMHTSITHDAHANSHILRPLDLCQLEHGTYNCCGHPINNWSDSEIGYICNSCRNLIIHAKCALLPDTVTHNFDKHPLKLITTTQSLNIDDHQLVRGEQMFCEICENDIDDTKTWYYGCKACDNYFHTTCIPCVDRLSKIKFGFTVRVSCHDCPLVAVRALSVEGYRCQCGRCERIITTESDEIAFECSKCYFRIRRECAAREINDICLL